MIGFSAETAKASARMAVGESVDGQRNSPTRERGNDAIGQGGSIGELAVGCVERATADSLAIASGFAAVDSPRCTMRSS